MAPAFRISDIAICAAKVLGLEVAVSSLLLSLPDVLRITDKLSLQE